MELDNEQQIAVTTSDRKVLVIAGAGSGKTRVITERVRYLIGEGVPPNYIVCITFTNLAAQEMQERLKDVPGIENAFIGTIHSFANKILRYSGLNFTILNMELKLTIYGTILTSELYKRLVKYLELEKLCKMGKADKRDLKTFFYTAELSELRLARQRFLEICKERNIITFDELLKLTKDYYEQTGESISYLLVDELQDLDNLEFNFIKALNADNYFLVGDDWQSIYSFKGGDVSIFKNLVENDNYTKFFLSNNYRNAEAIADVGSVVIKSVKDKVSKSIVIKNDTTKGIVRTVNAPSLYKCLQEIQSMGNYKDWFILSRNNKNIFKISDLLKKLEIPFTTLKKSGINFSELNNLMALDTVKLLTIHSAKGLECKNVILYGNFPVDDLEILRSDEEKKIMYVGITRAIENLIIIYDNRR